MVFAINRDIIMAFSSIEASSCHTEVEDRGNIKERVRATMETEKRKRVAVSRPFSFPIVLTIFLLLRKSS